MATTADFETFANSGDLGSQENVNACLKAVHKHTTTGLFTSNLENRKITITATRSGKRIVLKSSKQQKAFVEFVADWYEEYSSCENYKNYQKYQRDEKF